MSRKLTTAWRDAFTPPGNATGSVFIADAGTEPEITALLDALQGASDIELETYNLLVHEDYVGTAPETKGAAHPYADARIHVQLIYSTTNPSEFTRVSVFGPKSTIEIGKGNAVDPTQAAFTALNAAVADLVVSNSGAATTTPRSAQLINPT